jgi:hypothetical protein
VQYARHGERKRCYRSIKENAVVRFHTIQTLHRTDRRFQDGATRIPEFLTGSKMWLLTDNPVTGYLLDFAICIRDDPMPAQ